MWGTRVIIPENLQSRVLESLHENHSGITRMKSMARGYFWWSGLDQKIEPAPVAAPLHLWIWPHAPSKHIRVDFAGPFLRKMFFIVVDAHSIWPKAVRACFLSWPSRGAGDWINGHTRVVQLECLTTI